MYVVSCRKDFESNIVVGKTNRCRNYTQPGDHTKFQDIDLDVVVKAATNKHVCVLVHGFNNPIANVAKSYWELVTGVQTKAAYGLVVGFTWPGSRTPAGYFGAVPKANRSAPFLRDLINALRPVALSVDVQTHSLGARVALKALADPAKVFVDNLMLTAPAVDHHCLEPGAAFGGSVASCNRCFVYFSKNDPVLKSGFWVGDVVGGIHAALGLKGPRSKAVTLEKTPNVYVVDCSARVKTHGGYRLAPEYFAHWNEILEGGPVNRYGELS
jgi:esterase/lipase superfamily enzyme